MKSVVLLLFLLVQFLLFLPVHSQFVGNWTATEGSMTTSRKEHTGTLLQNGLVLVAGGFNNGGYLSSSELFDLSTGQWTATTNSMNALRSLHTATLLPNGLVLVAGAYNGVVLNSAELFDPSTGQWTPTGSMSSKRYRHTATLLPNGGVLVTGGFSTAGDTAVSSAEIFNVSTGVWTLTIGSMTTTRVYHTATLLQNGDVLVSGGQTEVSSGYLSSAEIFSPSTSLWTSTDSMTTARSVHTQILLENGLVLAAGGIDGSTLSSSELFNVSTGVWTGTGDMTAERYWHTVNLLQNGFVLAAGGCCSLGSSEVFNSATGSWSATDTMTMPRSDHTTIIYQNGLVLAAGGVDGSLDYLSSSEIFSNNFAISTPTLTPTPTPTPTSIRTPKSTPTSTSTSTSTPTPTPTPKSTPTSTPTSKPTVTYSQTTPALSTSRTSPSPTSSPSSSSNGSYSTPTSTVSPTTINSTEATLTPVPAAASNAGAIAGGVIGGLLGVVLFVLLLWFLIAKYRREKHRNSSDYINPIIPMSDVKFERASSQVSESRSAGGLSSLSHRQSEDIYISFDAIKLGAILGQGHFGEVYQADYTGAQVAVKKTKGLDEKAMLEEATMIKSIPPHPNVLHYYGVSQDNGECMMVTELCDKGNLAHYLREHSVSESQLRQFCRQIASAMWHISKYGIIHRDLRAENVLLSGSEMKVKVADFGLARLLQNPSHHEESNSGSSYYRMAQGKLIPIPWTPPEVLNPTDKFKYVAASDVWSFGVVMWEIYNHGAKPFDGADVQIVMAIICDNKRTSSLLPRPTDCPDDIFAIIQSCWAFNPQDRPTFEQLYNQLS